VGCQHCWRSVQDWEDELDWTEDWCGTTADCQIGAELQACDWANNAVKRATLQGLAKVQEKWETWQRYLSAVSAARSCDHGHKHVIANVFCHCVKMLLGSFNYIVIFLRKISTQLSGFWFISCRKKPWLKCYLVCTDKHVQIQYKQHNPRGRFFGPLCSNFGVQWNSAVF